MQEGTADYGDPIAERKFDPLWKAVVGKLAAGRRGADGLEPPMWTTWPGSIPPGPPGAPGEPFPGFVEPVRKPAAARGPVTTHVVHIPVMVRSDAAAVALALQLAVESAPRPEVDHLGTVVIRRSDSHPLGVFCGSVDVDGRRCARLYNHDPREHHDPDWQAMTPPGSS